MRRIPIVCLALAGLAACGGNTTDLVDRDAAPGDDAPPGGIDAGMIDGGGEPGCPPYQEMCGTECIPISIDPANCGGCGVTCGVGEVCSAGGCATTCEAGLTACAGHCVDLKTDSEHCNACDFACADGTGCVDGTCQALVPVGPTPAICEGGGPPVDVDGFPDGPECIGGVVETTFRWAVCSCQDIDLFNPLLTDAYDSTEGPYVPGQLGGGVGLNGGFTNSNPSAIFGDLWASSSTGGVLTANMTTIHQDLHSGGPLTVGNPFIVGEDAFVVGDVSTSASIDIAGALHMPAGTTITGDVEAVGGVITEPVIIPPACDCAPDEIIPVAGIVAAHRTNNDNALIGLDPLALADVNQPLRLELPCGRYYLDGIDTQSPLVISAMGRTALFVDGDILTSAPLAFVVGPAGELDIFVFDKLTTSAKMSIGSPNYPALTRVYLGGVGTSLTITNDVLYGGFLYLARGRFQASNPITVYGGIIAGEFRNSGSTTIHYDRQVLESGDVCPPDGDGCETCADCGNQACNDGVCGECTSDADCCAPLECENGTCVIIVD